MCIKSRISQCTWNIIKQLKIHSHSCRPTHRGKRAGCRKSKLLNYNLPTIIHPTRVQVLVYATHVILLPTKAHQRPICIRKPTLPSYLLFNARSAYNKLDELSTFIVDNEIDVCAITETWFKWDLPPDLVSIPGYSMFAKSREHRVGGGVAFYVRHQFNATQVTDISTPDNLEIVWVKLRPVRLPRTIASIFCAVVYFPQPDMSVEAQMIEHILSTIDLLTTRYPQAGFVILGDFNQMNTDPLITDQQFKPD